MVWYVVMSMFSLYKTKMAKCFLPEPPFIHNCIFVTIKNPLWVPRQITMMSLPPVNKDGGIVHVADYNTIGWEVADLAYTLQLNNDRPVIHLTGGSWGHFDHFKDIYHDIYKVLKMHMVAHHSCCDTVFIMVNLRIMERVVLFQKCVDRYVYMYEGRTFCWSPRCLNNFEDPSEWLNANLVCYCCSFVALSYLTHLFHHHTTPILPPT